MISFLLFFALSKPPPKLTRYGCEIQQISVAHSADTWWKLVVWKEYSDRTRTREYYAQTEGTEKGRTRILKECDKWMKKTEKSLTKR